LDMNKKNFVRAHSNIALIKYWGKTDEALILPYNSSVSLTLDAFYTDTSVVFHKELENDQFYLNSVLQDSNQTFKVSQFLDLFRHLAGTNQRAMVNSKNHVPTAAGLASSASGYAALAGAANLALQLDLGHQALSRLARRGSGSATRSIYGGFVMWQAGNCDEDSYAIPIDEGNWDIGMIVIVINQAKKLVSSREAMKRTVDTSPFYSGWLNTTEKDLMEINSAIINRDFEKMGSITERNGLMMHATMLGANPPISYWEKDSIVAMQMVKSLRQCGLACYFTMDAGPNVKVLCKASQSEQIKAYLAQTFKPEQLIITKPGCGIRICKGEL
jgi:diphosphomevalonate decarboxylase